MPKIESAMVGAMIRARVGVVKNIKSVVGNLIIKILSRKIQGGYYA